MKDVLMNSAAPVEQVGSSAARIFAGTKWGQMVRFDAEGAGSGTGDAGAAAAAEKAAADKEAATIAAAEQAAKTAGKETDAEVAKLLKESMKRKEDLKTANAKLAAFDGVDPDEYKALKAEKAAAEKASLEAKGDFERVKKMMSDEHTKALDLIKKDVETARGETLTAQKRIEDLTVKNDFSASDFIKTDLVVTPAKARQIYGDHFAVVDGVTVAYDKAVSAKTKTMLVDASGEPLSFDDALKRLVDKDPEKDTILKSKMAPGSGSNTQNPAATSRIVTPPTGIRGTSRIAAGLTALKSGQK